MSRSDILRIPDYLGHIVEAIERIDEYLADVSEITFLEDRKTQDAVIRNFEIVGEAAHNIERYHAQFAAAHPEVPWTVFMPCATVLRTVTLKSIWKSSGKRSTPTCRVFTRRFAGCSIRSARQAVK